MSLQTAMLRIAELNSLLIPPTASSSASAASGGATATASAANFAGALQSAVGGTQLLGLGQVGLGGGDVANRILTAARSEVGQAEMPPGSNDSPRIAEYRTATAGSGVGPWCAYFVSWAANQAGAPVGEAGQGFGSVDALYGWAQRTGRAIPAGSQPPQPGDLIVWDEHIGIVEAVNPDGTLQTIEGNSSDQVSRRTRPPGEALGYVRLG